MQLVIYVQWIGVDKCILYNSSALFLKIVRKKLFWLIIMKISLIKPFQCVFLG
jgi:hypothetical protein